MAKKSIEGATLFGEERKYVFELLNAEVGGKLFHEFAPKFFELIGDNQGEINVLEMARKIPSVFSWPKIKQLAKSLLAGSTTEIEGVIHEVGETGIGDYTVGDPMELYTAIFYAIRANYPKYIDPLFGGDAKDLSPDTMTETEGQS